MCQESKERRRFKSREELEIENLKRELFKEKRERREDIQMLKKEMEILKKEIKKLRGQIQVVMEANRDNIKEMERKEEEQRKIITWFEEWRILKEKKKRRGKIESEGEGRRGVRK